MGVIAHIVGARPNMPKFAPVFHALAARGATQAVIHTGQHYDHAMSDEFFRLLDLPSPDVNLGIGSHSHAVQTARIMTAVEPVIESMRPDWVVVYGDVNSTVAATLVAVKMGIRVAHVEAGLRSFDRSMPEEINRIVTDRLSTLLLTHSHEADDQLRAEGEPEDEIAFVGNCMIDSLTRVLPRIDPADVVSRFGVSDGFVLCTFHRPSNVDDPNRLSEIARALAEIARERPVFMAAHPRTLDRISAGAVDFGDVIVHGPISYLDMVALETAAFAVLTDSGGVQEETSFLGVPCVTLRENTERRVTLTRGTNQLLSAPGSLPSLVRDLRRPAAAPTILGWDGHAGERVATALLKQ